MHVCDGSLPVCVCISVSVCNVCCVYLCVYFVCVYMSMCVFVCVCI